MIVTVLVDLTVAVAVGVVLALIVHGLKSRRRKASVVHDGADTYRIEGPLSFLSVDRVFSTLRNGRSSLSLSLKDVDYIDMSGAKALLTFIDHSHKAGVELGIKDLPPHVANRVSAVANDEQRDKLKTIVEDRRTGLR
jgi:SulP family sulfate permease